MAIPTIDQDALMRAVLAMDVYNRGYNWGVSWNPDRAGTELETDLPTQVGNWAVGDRQETPAIGFVAQAYTNGGQTILSFRGTDDYFSPLTDLLDLNPLPLLDVGQSDIWNGFGIGGGSPVGPQALAAINFYNSLDTSNIEMVGQGRS